MLVVFSGYNPRAIFALARSLKKNHIEEYSIIARDNQDSILCSEYSQKVIHIREKKELDKKELYPIFRQLRASSHDNVVIAPTTEALNRWLIDNRREIEECGVIVPCVEKDIYNEISDKHSFWELCSTHNICVPRILELSKEFKFKYVAKPKTYISKSGNRLIPIIVNNAEEHHCFINTYDILDFDIEEFVEGISYYLLYYFSKDGTVYSYSQQNLAQQPHGKSIVAAISSDVHLDPISETYINLLKEQSYLGFVMIELRYNNGDYYMIEANPRMWGPTQLYVDAGVPLIEAFLQDYGLIASVPDSIESGRTYYLWSGGMKDDIRYDSDVVWLEQGRDIVTNSFDSFCSADMYNRYDTLNIYYKEKENWRIKQ